MELTGSDSPSAAASEPMAAPADAPLPAATGSEKGSARGWLIILILAAAALRFSTLGLQSFEADEGFTVEIIRHSFGGVLGAVRATESTPPLYYYLAWAWSHLFGSTEFGIRSLSALLGTLAVPVCFATARDLFGRRAGLLCAALVTFSPLLVWYSQEARAYSLLAFLGVLSLWLCVRAERGEPGPLWGWAAVAAAALATHYFAAFTVIPEAAWLLWRQGRRRRVWVAAALPAATGAALLPLLLHQQEHVLRTWSSGYTVKDAVTGVAQGALVGPTWTPLIHRAGVAALAALCLAGLGLAARSQRVRRRSLLPLALLLTLLGVPLIAGFVSSNYVVIRNVIIAIPLVFMLVAAGGASTARFRGGLSLIAAISAIGLAIVVAVAVDPALQRADWRGAIRSLASGTAPRVWVILDRFDSTPVSEVYLRHAASLGTAPVSVSEIAVIGRIGYGRPVSAPPAPGFRLTARRDYRGLAISQFRSSHPIPVVESDFRQFDARLLISG